MSNLPVTPRLSRLGKGSAWLSGFLASFRNFNTSKCIVMRLTIDKLDLDIRIALKTKFKCPSKKKTGVGPIGPKSGKELIKQMWTAPSTYDIKDSIRNLKVQSIF